VRELEIEIQRIRSERLEWTFRASEKQNFLDFFKAQKEAENGFSCA
jgi:hypothetical protein